eukprot:TRINITY_DN55272_c0_g1_i1.p2 TRINITY_DN55272_c0_g1~~TRINITY_DN55272_c0_g1_i1.p2  ORF type:complete len:265 (+),score=47.68 TRINITY_DN55272_c0_g1_i1:134-928(+)
MAFGMSSSFSGRSRQRMRQQLWGGGEGSAAASPATVNGFNSDCGSPCMSPNRAARCHSSHQPTLQTVLLGDPGARFYGAPKWPRAASWRVTNSPRGDDQPGPRPPPPRAGSADIPQVPTLPDLPCAPLTIEEEALTGHGPLGCLNLTHPRRYGITHPGRYGESDPEGHWKQTMLEKNMRAEHDLRQRLRALRFPKLNMLQPTRPARVPQPPPGPRGKRARVGREPERRNVVLPKSIRSAIVVDARGRRIITEQSVRGRPTQKSA